MTTAEGPRGWKAKPPIGWREWVELPGLCPALIKAKVDTGARTSALHAFDLDLVDESDGSVKAVFEVRTVSEIAKSTHRVSLPVVEFREIRSSDGRVERRPIVRTPVRLGDTEWDIDLSLTNRDQMGFRMLLGRSALKRRYVVDSGRSYLQSPDDSPDLTDAPDEEKT